MKKCPKCGTLNKDEFAFCEECGSALGAVEASASPKEEKRSGKKPLWLWCALGALVLIVALVAIFAIGKPGADKAGQTETAADVDESSPQSDDVPVEYGWCLSEVRDDDNTLSAKYEYDEAGNLSIIYHYEYDGTIWATTKFEYDEMGRRLSDEYIYNDGTIGYLFTNVWDAEQDIVYESPCYGNRYDDLVLTSHEKYEYDSRGNLVGVYDSVNADAYRFSYDKNNYLIEISVYEVLSEDECILDYTVSFAYDENHNLIREEEHNEDALYEAWTTYLYDEDGQVIMEKEECLGILYTTVYTYDENGHLTHSEKSSDSSSHEITSYTYEYDENGNLIEETYYNGRYLSLDPEEFTSTEYSIEYIYEWGPITEFTEEEQPEVTYWFEISKYV